jgi:hypothetical protein
VCTHRDTVTEHTCAWQPLECHAFTCPAICVDDGRSSAPYFFLSGDSPSFSTSACFSLSCSQGMCIYSSCTGESEFRLERGRAETGNFDMTRAKSKLLFGRGSVRDPGFVAVQSVVAKESVRNRTYY